MRPTGAFVSLAMVALRVFGLETRDLSELISPLLAEGGSGDTCVNTCQTFLQGAQTCETLTCLCTKKIEKPLQACINCLVTASPRTALDLAKVAEGYNSQCSFANIATVTVPGLPACSSTTFAPPPASSSSTESVLTFPSLTTSRSSSTSNTVSETTSEASISSTAEQTQVGGPLMTTIISTVSTTGTATAGSLEDGAGHVTAFGATSGAESVVLGRFGRMKMRAVGVGGVLVMMTLGCLYF